MNSFIIDTCVWIDFLRGRRHSSYLALIIVQKRKSKIIMPLVVLRELQKLIPEIEINSIANFFKDEIVYIREKNNATKIAKRISRKRNLPFGDALIAVLAGENNSIVITTDNHFKQLSDICSFIHPDHVL
jgi:predicted nucleic acid-binding protein